MTITLSQAAVAVDDPVGAGLVVFTPAVGNVSVAWQAGGTQLVVVIVSAAVGVSSSALATSWSVTTTGLVAAGNLSSPSPPQTVAMSGTWGVPTAPVVLAATAADTGRNVGIGTGDTLTLLFDQPVTQVDVHDTTSVLAVLAFTPSLSSYASAVQLAGVWSGAALTITFAVDGVIASDLAPWDVQSLTVAVVASGGVTSGLGVSPPSNCSAVVAAGSWGAAPSAALTIKSSAAVTLVLSPPPRTPGVYLGPCRVCSTVRVSHVVCPL